MKVVCIDNNNDGGWEHHLTIGKVYEVIKEKKLGYVMIDDKGNICGCFKCRFKLLSEIRNEKIDKLLN